MNTNSTNNSSLVLHAQKVSCLEDGRCHPGILSFNPGKGYVFEETLPRPAYVPNPRIFDGEHLSVARRRDGRIQPHLKTKLQSSSISGISHLHMNVGLDPNPDR